MRPRSKNAVSCTGQGAVPASLRSLSRVAAGLAAALSLTSCVTDITRNDLSIIHHSNEAYYQSQINDCLARAANGELFVWQTVNNDQATGTAKITGNIAGGQTLTHTATSAPSVSRTRTGLTTQNGAGVVSSVANTAIDGAGVVVTALSTASRPLTFSLQPEFDNKLQATAAPSIDSGNYAPFLQFLNYSWDDLHSGVPLVSKHYDSFHLNKIDSFVRWDGKSEYAPGTMVHHGKYTYVVPKEFSGIYFDLCMAVVTGNKLDTYTAGKPTNTTVAPATPKGSGAAPPGPSATPPGKPGPNTKTPQMFIPRIPVPEAVPPRQNLPPVKPPSPPGIYLYQGQGGPLLPMSIPQ